jgi:transglutaminase-like putative cysteine protease
MKFEVKAELRYQVFSDSTIILNIHALNTVNQKVIAETFYTNPTVKFKEFKTPEKRLVSIEIPPNQYFSISYNATAENVYVIRDYAKFEDLNIAKLPPEILAYLHPSRYCQSDRLYRLANNMFRKKGNDFEKVSALTNWIYLNIEYLIGSTNTQTSAYDTVTEQAGVCRDFAHLGIALCRALTIPARYFTGYAYQLSYPDFHACFEAYIDGDWLLFDATRLAPLNGMIKIATGTDAADAAVASIFGNVRFMSSQVSCNLIEDNFEPYYGNPLSTKGISYL